jgi:hypothetical protein
MSTYLMIEFYLWHGIAMFSVVAIAFTAGYYTGRRKLNSEH